MIQVLEHHGHLKLHGALFRISDGRLFWLDEHTGAYRPVAKKAYEAAFMETQA
jgi:carbonic anhydrase